MSAFSDAVALAARTKKADALEEAMRAAGSPPLSDDAGYMAAIHEAEGANHAQDAPLPREPEEEGAASANGRALAVRANLQPHGYLPVATRLLPQSPDAERALLGSILMAPDAVMRLCVEKGVSAKQFHIPAHALIYGLAMEMWRDSDSEIDLVTVTQKLLDRGQLDEVGGAAQVAELFISVPSAANAGYYIEIVREKATLRRIITTCTESAARAYDEQENVAGLMERVTERVLAIKDEAGGRKRLPGLVDCAHMLGEAKPPKPAELVMGMLHKGSKFIVGGTSKGRKTFSLIDLAVSVATGSDWWGNKCEQGAVCYINFEIQERFFYDRVEDICRAKGVKLAPGQLVSWTLRGHGEGIEKMMHELMEVLLSRRFVLIIFDPIYKALGGRNENDAGDIASLCNELERIAVQTGAAVAFGAHYSKGNQAMKESIDRIGGSGVFARDPDSILTMTAHEDEDCFVVEATLRNFKPIEPFVVKWDWPLFTRNDEKDATALKQAKKPGGFEQQFTPEQITGELSAIDGISPGELCKRMSSQYGMSRATFFRLKSGLEKAKKIVARGNLLYSNGAVHVGRKV